MRILQRLRTSLQEPNHGKRPSILDWSFSTYSVVAFVMGRVSKNDKASSNMLWGYMFPGAVWFGGAQTDRNINSSNIHLHIIWHPWTLGGEGATTMTMEDDNNAKLGSHGRKDITKVIAITKRNGKRDCSSPVRGIDYLNTCKYPAG